MIRWEQTMKLIENRIADDETHTEFLKSEPFCEVFRNKFCGELLLRLPEGEDPENVTAYRFRVSEMVDQWIDINVCGDTRRFDKAAVKKAESLVKDLEAMIQRLRDAMPT